MSASRAVRARAAALLAAAWLAGCARASAQAHAQAPTPVPTQARPAAAAPTRVDTAALHRTLDSLAAAHHGVVGYLVRDIDSGAELARRADETFPTASLIKVAILVTLYDQVAQGKLALDDPLTVLKIDQVPGSGVLQFMHPGLALSVRDAAWLMSTLSDNTATNLILDRIAIRRVWEKMEALGLPHTKVHAKVFLRITSVAPDSSVKYGLGVTTPREMAKLFELMANGKAVSPAADSAMLDILRHNEDNTKLARNTGSVRFAHKTGDVDEARTDCGLFTLSSRVAVCVLTKENADKRYVVDDEAHLMMGRMGEAIVKAWGPPPKPASAP